LFNIHKKRKREFKNSYRSNLIITLIYEYPFKKPRLFFLNIFMISFFFYFLFIFAYLWHGLFYEEYGPSNIASFFHLGFLIVIPAILILMKLIYTQLDSSMKKLRDIITKEDLENFDNKTTEWENMFHSKYRNVFIIIFLTLTIANIIYKTILEWGNVDYPNSFEYYPLIAIISSLFFIVSSFICGAFIWHLITIVRIIRQFCQLDIELIPLHPDKAAGLKPLTKVTSRMNYLILISMIVPLWWVFVMSVDPYDPSILSMAVPVTILSFIVFLLPLTKAHGIMSKKKKEHLELLSKEYHQLNKKLIDVKNKKLNIKKKYIEKLNQIQDLYQKTDRMPVWPFNLNYLIKIIVTIGLPLVILFSEVIVSVLFERIIG